ncbi:MAG TPA: hypothetical protein VEU27_01130 [Gemmatimonadales bacterium]|nr:hypothetical protein [Gemmatimonadales bacterium]
MITVQQAVAATGTYFVVTNLGSFTVPVDGQISGSTLTFSYEGTPAIRGGSHNVIALTLAGTALTGSQHGVYNDGTSYTWPLQLSAAGNAAIGIPLGNQLPRKHGQTYFACLSGGQFPLGWDEQNLTRVPECNAGPFGAGGALLFEPNAFELVYLLDKPVGDIENMCSGELPILSQETRGETWIDITDYSLLGKIGGSDPCNFSSSLLAIAGYQARIKRTQ